MASKKDGDDLEDNNEVALNIDWDDNDSTEALESQQILSDDTTLDVDPELEEEIRANLSSKLTSSLHAYKIAGLALIVALVSFTLNTVSPLILLFFDTE